MGDSGEGGTPGTNKEEESFFSICFSECGSKIKSFEILTAPCSFAQPRNERKD